MGDGMFLRLYRNFVLFMPNVIRNANTLRISDSVSHEPLETTDFASIIDISINGFFYHPKTFLLMTYSSSVSFFLTVPTRFPGVNVYVFTRVFLRGFC